jgi:hypothetical protein
MQLISSSLTGQRALALLQMKSDVAARVATFEAEDSVHRRWQSRNEESAYLHGPHPQSTR